MCQRQTEGPLVLVSFYHESKLATHTDAFPWPAAPGSHIRYFVNIGFVHLLGGVQEVLLS